MEEIKAFVAHSFNEEDENVVKKFLNFFNTIKELPLGFSWDHAERAEPKILSEKVKQKMENKNTLIGICTANEIIIKNPELSRCFFHKSTYKLSENNFEWKTSDWIIQEIGFAYGKDMELILLVEEGLKQPGGLQGNFEFITFSRNEPEKVFTKILEMIQNLVPTKEKNISSSIEPIEKPQTITEKEKPENQDEERLPNVEESWSKEDYSDALFEAISLENGSEEQEIINKYINKFCGQDNSASAKIKAKSFYYHTILKKGNYLNRLQKLLNENPNDADINFYLGASYSFCEQYETAHDYYYKASHLSTDLKAKIKYLSDALICLVKTGKSDVTKYFDEISQLDPKNKYKSFILKTITSVADICKNDILYCAALEGYLKINPLDSSKRFDLASRYHKIERHDLSYFHYKFLTSNADEASYWNNLGVAAVNLGLAGKSISSYRKAEKLGNPLAMGNIAHKMIDNGFLDEATELCNKALKIEGSENNAPSALVAIKEKINYETKEEEKIIEQVKKKREFLLKISEAQLMPTLKLLPSQMIHPNCELRVEVNANKFSANGSYTRKYTIPNIMNSLLQVGETKEISENYQITIDGTVTSGHYIEAFFLNVKEGLSVEERNKSLKNYIVIVNNDKTLIEFYDKEKFEKDFELKKMNNN